MKHIIVFILHLIVPHALNKPLMHVTLQILRRFYNIVFHEQTKQKLPQKIFLEHTFFDTVCVFDKFSKPTALNGQAKEVINYRSPYFCGKKNPPYNQCIENNGEGS